MDISRAFDYPVFGHWVENQGEPKPSHPQSTTLTTVPHRHSLQGTVSKWRLRLVWSEVKWNDFISRCHSLSRKFRQKLHLETNPKTSYLLLSYIIMELMVIHGPLFCTCDWDTDWIKLNWQETYKPHVWPACPLLLTLLTVRLTIYYVYYYCLFWIVACKKCTLERILIF